MDCGIEILYEDKDILVVKKPAGIESQSSRSFAPDMVSEIKKHINKLSTKKGEPYVGIIHRLDKPVGGVMVYAKTQKAAAALSRQVKEHDMEKVYYAVVCGRPVDNVDNFVDYLLKDGGNHRSKLVDKGIKGAKRAELRYRCLDTVADEDYGVLSLVEIRLITGRHHQIRVQFAGRGLPLWGDNRYNPQFFDGSARMDGGQAVGRRSVFHGKNRENLALSACRLSFSHPVTGKRMYFEIKPEGAIFQKFQLHKSGESGYTDNCTKEVQIRKQEDHGLTE